MTDTAQEILDRILDGWDDTKWCQGTQILHTSSGTSVFLVSRIRDVGAQVLGVDFRQISDPEWMLHTWDPIESEITRRLLAVIDAQYPDTGPWAVGGSWDVAEWQDARGRTFEEIQNVVEKARQA